MLYYLPDTEDFFLLIKELIDETMELLNNINTLAKLLSNNVSG